MKHKLPHTPRHRAEHVRRHGVAFTAGAVIMLAGVVVAKEGHHWMPLVLADMIGYGIHGLGMFPFARNVEPLWRLLTDGGAG